MKHDSPGGQSERDRGVNTGTDDLGANIWKRAKLIELLLAIYEK